MRAEQRGTTLLPPTGLSSSDAAQDTVGLLDCKHSLLAYVKLFVHQKPPMVV